MTREKLIAQLESQGWECAKCGGRFTIFEPISKIFDGVGLAHADCIAPTVFYVPDPAEATS